MPDIAEQIAIVKYLDRQCDRIDRAVKAKRRLVELLDEQKQALIHRAVTRGLHLNIKLKPSGVDWLGDVPQHWAVMPLKRIGTFRSGNGFPVERQGLTGEDFLFVKVSDLNRPGNETLVTDSANTVSSATARELGATVFPAGAIVFPKVGGALLTNKRRVLSRASCIDNNLMACTVLGANRDFAFEVLRHIDLGDIAKPGPVPAIGEGDVGEIRVALPPLQEQVEIVQELHRELGGMDRALSATQAQIKLLEEYRARLISDVVTGKVDVRRPSGDPDAAEEVLDVKISETLAA